MKQTIKAGATGKVNAFALLPDETQRKYRSAKSYIKLVKRTLYISLLTTFVGLPLIYYALRPYHDLAQRLFALVVGLSIGPLVISVFCMMFGMKRSIAIVDRIHAHVDLEERRVLERRNAAQKLIPAKTFKDIAGMANVKSELRKVVESYCGKANDPDLRVNGVLLHGEPGCGKSFFAECVAGEFGLSFIKPGVEELTSKWVNEGSERIAEVFRKAEENQPALLFLDEIDAIAARRDSGNGTQEDVKGVNALLQKIDECRGKEIIIIAATNNIEAIDPAVIRDGRFDKRIRISLPDAEAREAIIRNFIKKKGPSAGLHDYPLRIYGQPLNAFEAEVGSVLVERFKEEEGYLLHGFKVGGVELDHLLITRRGVVVVEDKGYGGPIEGSVNTQWTAGDEPGKLIACGDMTNPFEQVQRYCLKVKDALRREYTKEAKVYGLAVFPADAQIAKKIKGYSHRFVKVINISEMTKAIEAIEGDIEPASVLSPLDLALAESLGRGDFPEDIDYALLTKQTEGMSASTIMRVLKDGLRLAIESGTPPTTQTLMDELKKGGNDRPTIEKVTWDDVVLADAVKSELMSIPKMLEDVEVLESLGISDIGRGVILYGPPGTGKTQIAKALAFNSNASFYTIEQADVLSTGGEKKIRDVYRRARENAPSIVFIDEADSILKTRGEAAGATDGVVNAFLTEVEGLKKTSPVRHVLTVLATNRLEGIDAAVLSRFGKNRYFIPLPDENARIELLKLHIGRVTTSGSIDIQGIAKKLDGYSGREIGQIVTSAGEIAYRAREQAIREEHIWKAIRERSAKARPYVKRLGWEDLIVNASVKEELMTIHYMVAEPERFERLGSDVKFKGVVLTGPPGTGKTLAAKVLASTTDCSFFQVTGSDILDMYRGGSEKKIRDLYASARESAPSIVFIDEADSMLKRRGMSDPNNNSVVNEFLAQIDGFASEKGGTKVFTILATNRCDELDEAILSRLPVRIELALPDQSTRAALFNLYTKKIKKGGDFDYEKLGRVSAGLSGRDIQNIVERAVIRAGIANRQNISEEDLISETEKRKTALLLIA